MVADPAGAQEAVRVRAGTQPGMGRMVFDWAAAVGYDARIDGRVLTITFDRAARLDLSALNAALSGYVASSEPAADGKSVRLTLTGDYQLRKLTNGNAVVVDLIGAPQRASAPAPTPTPTPTPAPAPTPAPPPAQAPKPEPAAAPPVSLKPKAPVVAPAAPVGDVILRGGQQQAFTRLVFGWPAPAPTYKITKNGLTLDMTFDRNARVDLGRFADATPRYIRALRTGYRDGKTFVAIDTDPGVTYRTFSEDRDIIVDIIGARSGANPAPVEPEAKQIAEDARLRAEAAAGAPLPDAPKTFDPETGPLPARLTPPALANAQRADAEQRAAAEMARLAATRPPEPTPPVSKSDTRAPTMPSETAPTRVTPRVGPPATNRVQPTPAGSVGTVVVTQETLPDRQRVTFPLPVLTPMAAFTRAGKVWAVFDAQATLDLKAVSGPPFQARQIAMPRGTVALLDLPEGRGVEVSLDGNSWVVDFPANPDRGEPVEIVPRPTQPGGADVLVQIKDRGDIQHLSDPVVGDKLEVATTIRPGHGLASLHSFLGFDILPTHQGAVVAPIKDGILVQADPEGLVVSQDGGLLLSNGVRPTEQAIKGAGGTAGAEGFIEYEKWARANEGPFRRVRSKLERASAVAPKSLKNAARLELARFFLANHFDAETLGVLNLMQSTDPLLDGDPAFRAMRGVANLGMYRPKEALADLSVPALQIDANAALWRGLANTMLQDWPAAAAEFRRGLPLLDRYPVKERLRFRLASARANIELGDKEGAARDLNDINLRKPGPPDSIRAQYLTARLKEISGDITGATAEYDRVIATTDRQSRANARYHKTMMLEGAGKMASADVIEELETLRYTWRGDDLERDILRSLGLLYIKAGDYRAGFETMRTAMSMFADSRQAREIKDDMNRVFADLFLRGGANSLSPVKALGLYYDFRDLTPVGNDGDEMIRRLADRMVSVDLLPQASELLRHQVEKRLAGTAQALVAARLAVIYLLDKKPGDALQILDQTKQVQLPAGITAERGRLRARALMEMGRTADAIQTLANDNSLDSQYLRADILWTGQQWPEAGAKLEDLLGPVKAADVKLDPLHQNLILRAAISYALAGDRASLNRLSGMFGARMAKSSDAESFTALTASPDIANVGFRDLASKIASTKTYESFLSSYRDRIRNGGLNAIN